MLVARECAGVDGGWAGLDVPCSAANCPEAVALFGEGFESVPLTEAVHETADDNIWTRTPPVGWRVDRSRMPAGGVEEWRGWSFARPTWWVRVAEDQGRSTFTKARGVVAVADPDEWDDREHEPGAYTTTLTSPPISIEPTTSDTTLLVFDSSWRPDEPQTAMVEATFDDGTRGTIPLDSYQSLC